MEGGVLKYRDLFYNVFFRVRTIRPKLGVFSIFSKYSFFCCFITQLVKKLQQWSLYEVIEDILPFVLNTKRPLSDIWLLRYKQNSFGCFQENSECKFFLKTEAVLYSKRTAGYPQSPHIKTIASAFLQAE